MGRLLKSLLSLCLLPAIYAFLYEAVRFLLRHREAMWSNWFLLGFVTYFLLYAFVLRSKMGFLEVFEHELAHTVTALLFFRSVHLFVASPAGGFVKIDQRANFLVTLAPYFLPVFTLPLLAIKPFVSAAVQSPVDFLIGVTLAFHYLALFQEFHHRQPDLQRSGLVFAFVMVVFFNTVITVVVLCFVLRHYGAVTDYLRAGATTTVRYYQILAHALAAGS